METEHAPVEAAGVSVAGALTSSDATSTPHAGATGTTLGLSVIIPAFNEQATIVEVVRRVLAQPLVAEVLVVDDGSSDGTGDALRWEAFPSSVRFLSHPQNRGKGAAIRTGVAAASQGIIIIQDADFEYDPADYPAVLQPIVEGRADVVYGSRFLTPRPYAFWLDLANRCLTATTNMLYGSRLTDMETCYKAFRADILKAVRIRSDRFDFEPEITAKILRRHCRIVEVPISYERRGYASGKKIRLRDAFYAVRALLRYRFFD
ncbi:MAG TPA: glycosyltransferase family 2 protein [Ktedonobacterales bacterium]